MAAALHRGLHPDGIATNPELGDRVCFTPTRDRGLCFAMPRLTQPSVEEHSR